MKKILFTLFLLCSSLMSYGQSIFNTIKHLDKFDDVTKTEKVKTLVDGDPNDLSFIVETKGKAKKTYYIFPVCGLYSYGSADSIVNIVKNVYGYQDDYVCIEASDTLKHNKWYNEQYEKADIDDDDITTAVNIRNNSPYIVTIVRRVITTQYTGDYLNEIFWIQKPDGSRIVYCNE